MELNKESIENKISDPYNFTEIKDEFEEWAKKEKTILVKNKKRNRRASIIILDEETKSFNRFYTNILKLFNDNTKSIDWQHISNDSKSFNENIIDCNYNTKFTEILRTILKLDKLDKLKCIHDIEEIKSILKLLGILRHNVIDIIIDNLKIKMNINKYYYTAFGSTNITSDFDLTICGGPEANLLCWNMFKTYYNIYESTLPQNFDSNLYVGAYDVYSPSKSSYNKNFIEYFKTFDMNIQKNNKGDKTNENLFTINIRKNEKKQNEPEDLMHAYIWALVKVLESGIEQSEFKESTSLFKYFINASTLKNNINYQICNSNSNLFESIKKEETIFNQEENDKTKQIITNYYMQYYFQEIVNEKIYQNYSRGKNDEIEKKVNEIIDNNNNLIYLRGFNLFFSSEAYYTDMTVQAIVLEGQADGNLGLTYDHYLIAALENVGDFYKHSSHDINKDDDTGFKTLIKYSKYIYRIYMCLSKVNEQYTDIKDKIDSSWVKLRKTYDRDEICDESEKVMCYEKGVQALNIPLFDKKNKNDKLTAIKNKLLEAVITEYNKIHEVKQGGYYDKYMKYKKKYLKLKNSQ